MRTNFLRLALFLAVVAVLSTLPASTTDAAPSGDRHYTLPCYQTVRAEYPDAPADVEAHFAWRNDPANTDRVADYRAALESCRIAHDARFGAWNFDSMILVRVDPPK